MIILLDMDGVMCDFFGGVFELYNTNLNHLDLPKPWIYGVDIWINHHLGMNINQSDLMTRIAEHPMFWEHLHSFSWCQELIDLSYEFTDEVYIASMLIESFYANGRPSNSYQGKVNWLKQHTQFDASHLICTKHKNLLASPDTILIDDCEGHTTKFEQSHGGRAILFPQDWNSNYFINDPIFWTRSLLTHYANE